MKTTDKLQEARQRDGQPAKDRPDEIEDFLQPEEPDFPKVEDPLKPDTSDDLKEVVESEHVGNVEDVANAIDSSESEVRKALDLHDIEAPTEGGSFDVPEVEKDGVIELPIGTVDSEYLRTPIYEDARILEHLYVECGLGVSDIKSVLEKSKNAGRSGDRSPWSVREADIRSALEAVGLIDGGDEGEPRTLEDEDHRLGGTNIDTRNEESPGASLNYEALESDPHVEIQPAGE